MGSRASSPRPPWASCCSRASATPSASRSRPARRRPHAGSEGRPGAVADHGLPHLRAAGRRLPGLRPHHLDHVSGARPRHPGLHPQLDAGVEDALSGRRGAQRRRDGLHRQRTGQIESTPTSHLALPGTGETPAAPVFIDGKKVATLRGAGVAAEFKQMVIDYIDRRYGVGTRTAAE